MKTSNLTEFERIAKGHVLKCVLEAANKPCDGGDNEFGLPKWYDEAKYKRGQKYFFENRFGIMQSNLYGLFSLLCEPRGLGLLDSTEKSSTSSTARKRYASTTLHMIRWYEVDLTPGSKSWKSLKKVRKMHAFASKSSVQKGIGFISQNEMCATVFGFMGYALIRPHLLGIKYDCDEDREGFIHFWATMSYMLGIEDKYNICLFPIEIVEAICNVYLCHFFMTWLQLETPLFKKMVNAVIDGLGSLIPLSSYGSRLFLAKRLAGIPGYQYNIDVSKEVQYKTYFSESELNMMKDNFVNRPGFEYMKGILFVDKLFLIDIKKFHKCQVQNDEDLIKFHLNNMKKDLNNNQFTSGSSEYKALIGLFGIKHSELLLTEVTPENYRSYLNDSKFKELSLKDQFIVRFNIMLTSNFAKIVNESFLSIIIRRIEKVVEGSKRDLLFKLMIFACFLLFYFTY